MARGVKTGGRQKGTPNKLTSSAKEAFSHAFHAVGGADGLAAWAKKNPTPFYTLYARLIPEDKNINLNAEARIDVTVRLVHGNAEARR